MKLDATDLRYVTPEEFRVLTAVRMQPYSWRTRPFRCAPLLSRPPNLIKSILSGRDGLKKPRGCAFDVDCAGLRPP